MISRTYAPQTHSKCNTNNNNAFGFEYNWVYSQKRYFCVWNLLQKHIFCGAGGLQDLSCHVFFSHKDASLGQFGKSRNKTIVVCNASTMCNYQREPTRNYQREPTRNYQKEPREPPQHVVNGPLWVCVLHLRAATL